MTAQRQRRLPPAISGYHARRQGLSSDEIAARFRLQEGLCMLCRKPMVSPVVDHDHALAALHGHAPEDGCRRCFRWLCCDPCNRGLGAFRDDPDSLERAAALLRLFREQNPLP